MTFDENMRVVVFVFAELSRRCDRPRAKGGAFLWPPDGGLLRQYHKKRGRFCASRVTYAANGQKPAVVLARNAQFQKSRVMSATENQPRQKKCFLSSRPEHNQKPPTDTANRHCSLIPTRRKNRRFFAGGAVHRPFSSGSVDSGGSWR